MLVTAPLDPGWETQATPVWASLDAFLADIGPRAFRFAEAGLRHHDDALDAVQDAMMKMLVYRDRPAGEWTPLFWSILRRRIIDMQRRAGFRLRWLRPAGDLPHADDASIDWADPGAGPASAHEQRESYARLVAALRALPPQALADLGVLAQRTPPQAREALRRELLAQAPAQRSMWLQAKLQ